MTAEKVKKDTANILYVRVNLANKKWVENEAKENGVSLSVMVDMILSVVKTQEKIRLTDLANIHAKRAKKNARSGV